jgi:plasmid maintenance system antidote protein VapI
MSQAELSERTGRPRKTINEIIQGKASITPETAIQLESVLGIPAAFWVERERSYQEFLARQREREQLRGAGSWMRSFPVREMIALGWLDERGEDVDQTQELLRFFGVATPEQWKIIWSDLHVSFRASRAYPREFGAVTAWLRRGELQARDLRCADFDKPRFVEALHAIRRLTPKPPADFEDPIKTLCAEAGVAMVFVPELKGTRAHGATRWLSPTKALIQLSLRYKTDDHLWFTFFHEAAHILLHGKRLVFVELDGAGTLQEQEADSFAADFLIPPRDYSAFRSRADFSVPAIQAFARKLGIAQGIVVGRLQHDKELPFNRCNALKRRFEWAGTDDEE